MTDYEDEFTRIVNEELEGHVCVDDREHRFVFVDIYDDDLEAMPLAAAPVYGWTLCTDFDARYIVYDTILNAMQAAVGKFFPAYTDVEQVLDVQVTGGVELFHCKDACSRTCLFVFDVIEVGYNSHSLSLTGPFDLGEAGLSLPELGAQLRPLRGMGLIQLSHELNSMRALRALELERRVELLGVAALSLSQDEGIGNDNFSLVARLLTQDYVVPSLPPVRGLFRELELERRYQVLGAAVLTLGISPDNGIGSIGEENFALVAELLMRDM